MIKKYKDFLKTNEHFFQEDPAKAEAEMDLNAEEETKAEAEHEEEKPAAAEAEETEEEGGDDLHRLASMLRGANENAITEDVEVSGNEIHYKGMTISKPSETNTFHLAIDDQFIDLNTEDAEAAKGYIDAYTSGDIKIEDLRALKRKRAQAQAQKNESRFVSSKRK